ncbi:MAG: hypothetical protein Q4F11_02480, partial [Eubacteriales bacterium]|nr:hypothetical protein [Eubacteriales bacterium]
MKKCLYICICMFALLMGCGNKMSNVNTDMATRETTDSEKDDVNVWSYKIETDFVEQLFASPEFRIECNNDGVKYEKNGIKSKLVYEQDGYYLSYESSEGNLKNVKLDICPKKPMDMYFYEEDIDWDGDKELLVSCTHSTGIGARM